MAKIMIAYVHPGKVDHPFLTSILGQIGVKGHEYRILGTGSGPLIARARNRNVKLFLEGDSDYFLSVDTDVAWPPDALDKLIAHDKDIVMGVYMGLGENETRFPVVLLKSPDGRLDKASWKKLGGRKAGLVQVDVVGMGFTLIKRQVLETLGTGPLWPFAETYDPETLQECGEDTTFCLRAKEAGFDSWLDTNTKVDHLKTQLV